MSEVVNVTETSYPALVEASSETPVFLDFWASWCGPCRMFTPIFERVASRTPNAVFGKVNTDEQLRLAEQFGIVSIPTLVAVKDGQVVYQQAGAVAEKTLSDIVNHVLGSE